MSEEQETQEGEIVPKGELPPWLGDVAKEYFATEERKLGMSIEADERSERRTIKLVWALLTVGVLTIVGLYVSGNRGDALLFATHVLAFGFGAATTRRLPASED